MGRSGKEINQVTGTVIGLAVRMILYAGVLLLLIEGCIKGYSFGHEIFCSTAVELPPGKDRTIMVAEGAADDEIADMLEAKGLIKSSLILRIQIKFYDYDIQPGMYTLNTSMTPKEILWILNQGTGEESEAGKSQEPKPQETKKPEPAETRSQDDVVIQID